ncbi:NAD(P)-dependent alcohol dehydrogenase [Streptomonospora sediminis]
MSGMRAVFYDRFGPPEVLYVGRTAVPEPAPEEVLVRVHATSVNGGELMGRAGRVPVVTGRRFPLRIGMDFAGEVAATGSAVRGLREGARVWGALPRGRFGAAAEYVTVRPRQFSFVPDSLTMVEAASLPVGTNAITALRSKAGLQAGERLLVRGASGGVGSVAVQLGKALGAHVTALAGPRNLDFVRGLGADDAISYTAVQPADLGPFDVVLDTAGTDHAAFRRLLAPGGRMVAIAFDSRRIAAGLAYVLASSVYGPSRVRFFSGNPLHDDFAELAGYVENGAIAPVVDSVHPLADIAGAHRALEGGGVRGKHIVEVG